MSEASINGCIIGTATGDALGLPYEGLPRDRAARMFGPPDRFRFFFRYGMASDDTEHTCCVAQALIRSAGDGDLFERELSRRLRRWFLLMPAGTGLATARACLKLCPGVSSKHSGVFSAGNGPAMRAALLGVFSHDLDQLKELVRRCTRITHTDPKAEFGALGVAAAAFLSERNGHVGPQDYVSTLETVLRDREASEFIDLMKRMAHSIENAEPTLRGCEKIESRTRGQQHVVWNSFHMSNILCGMNSTLHSFTTSQSCGDPRASESRRRIRLPLRSCGDSLLAEPSE